MYLDIPVRDDAVPRLAPWDYDRLVRAAIHGGDDWTKVQDQLHAWSADTQAEWREISTRSVSDQYEFLRGGFFAVGHSTVARTATIDPARKAYAAERITLLRSLGALRRSYVAS